MGTSVSHPSPTTLGWQAVAACYRNDLIPAQRTVNEIWRAAQHEGSPLVNDLFSDAVFSCQEAVRDSKSATEAVKKATREIFKHQGNSIIAEIARRSIPSAFQVPDKLSGWRSTFFAQITDYLLSRDISGYIGKGYRNKTVSELVSFKQTIKEKANQTVASMQADPISRKEWVAYSKLILNRLSGG
jgi:hypothetical protein